MRNSKVIVCGAAGFIGNHLVNRMKDYGNFVIGIDRILPDHGMTRADMFYVKDMTDPAAMLTVLNNHRGVSWIFQMAADMGGAGFIFTGDNDARIMSNSALINLNVVRAITAIDDCCKNVFFPSSACVYPYHGNFQTCIEDEAYPAMPDSEYGWEKLFSERLYLAHRKNFSINAKIARFHNIYGPLCSWNDGREKSIAAICRKVAMCPDGGTIDIWGDGRQLRSYLYVDDCLDGIVALCESDFPGPVNIGHESYVSIDGLVEMASRIAGKKVCIRHLEGPVGVCGRTSNNRLARERMGWEPKVPFEDGLAKTYFWVRDQIFQENP